MKMFCLGHVSSWNRKCIVSSRDSTLNWTGAWWRRSVNEHLLLPARHVLVGHHARRACLVKVRVTVVAVLAGTIRVSWVIVFQFHFE